MFNLSITPLLTAGFCIPTERRIRNIRPNRCDNNSYIAASHSVVPPSFRRRSDHVLLADGTCKPLI